MRKFFLILLIIVPVAEAALNRTYPTSATTQLRVEAYNDAIASIWKSNYVIKVDTWAVVVDSYTYIPGGPPLVGWFTDTSNWTLVSTSWTVSGYNAALVEDAKLKLINQILDEDVEEYMVFPATSTVGMIEAWKGWCLSVVNGKNVSIVCQ